MPLKPDWQRHGRTTLLDEHDQLQVLERLRQFFLPKDFQPSTTLLNQLSDGYDVADTVADALTARSIKFAPLLLKPKFHNHPIPADLQPLVELYAGYPDWFDQKLAKVGAAAYRRYPLLLVWILRNVALMAGYSIPALSLPLVHTGALVTDALPRLMRTYAYILSIVADDVLQVGLEGWRQSIQVRQIHALVRYKLLHLSNQKVWDTAYWGLPINQTDMVATHLQFSLLIMRGYQTFGARISAEEAAGILHLWRLASYWLGVDLARIPQTEAESWKWLYAYIATQQLDFNMGRPLAQALHDLPTQIMGEQNCIGQLTELVNASVTRVLVGDDIGDGLGLPKPRARYAILLTAPVLFGLDTASLHVPFVRRQLDTFARKRQSNMNWWLKKNDPYYQKKA